jgi:acetylornithine deacetylase/succinyl-diaminopimelate desuccinylase-like protein
MSLQTSLDYSHANRQRFLDELQELLSIPSISTLPEHGPDMVRAARWIKDRMLDMGIEAETIGDRFPLVYGEWLNAPGAPTILVYGHYDVQPVDPVELWTSPPFEPAIRNGNLYARGASDDKGQTMTLLDAAESYLGSSGALPVNLKFIIEGQEESGGEVIKAYVREHGERVRADVAQIADTHMFAPGIPSIETGLRGIVYTEVQVRGASHDLHSGLYGGVGPNPFNALAHIIAGLKDEQGHITIPGFYDAVQMPSEGIRNAWKQLPFEEAQLRHELGVAELSGEPKFTPIERMWARPTLDVHGIGGGFTGEGAKTVIPAEATAKISMRIVPDQRMETVFDLFRKRVEELSPAGVQVEVRLIHGDDPVVVPEDSVYLQAAKEALQQTFGQPAVLTRSGGSIPIVGILKEALGLNSVLMGWGLSDDNLHAPNEKFTIDNFYAGIDATVRFWEIAGRIRTG